MGVVRGSGEGEKEGRTVCADAALKLGDFGEGGTLTAGAEEVAQGASLDAAVAALVEELEGFAVVGGGLVVVIHCCSVVFLLSARDGDGERGSRLRMRAAGGEGERAADKRVSG